MAITIQLTDGTTTVDLNDLSNAGAMTFSPRGAWASDEFVEDEAIIDFFGSYSTARTKINQVNRIFARARERATTGTGPRCFAYINIDSEGTYRSELLDGKVDIGDESLGSDKAGGRVEAAIMFRRVPYWEGAVAQLAISNVNGSSNTSGLAVDNHSVSGSKSAWFSVSGSAIGGDVPAPVRVEMTNTSGTALGYLQYGLINGTTSWNHNAWLQGESATTGSGGTNTSFADASSGNYLSHVIGANTTTNFARWTITNSLLSLSDGKPVVPVARLVDAPTLEYMRIYCAGMYTEYASTTSTRYFVVMPSLPFPPRTMNGGTYADHTLEINYWNPNGSSDTVKLDFLALIPAGDGWREVISVGGNNYISNGHTLVDDGIEQLTYSLSGSNRQTAYSAAGKWPLLIPGVDATFATIAADNTVGDANIYYDWTAKLYYRPRRRSI